MSQVLLRKQESINALRECGPLLSQGYDIS